MEKTKRTAAYLLLLLLVFAGPCAAGPEPVCQYDASGVSLGMPLAEVEKLVSESELVEIRRDGKEVMKLYLELHDRHIVVTFKEYDKVPRVRTVEVQYLDAIFVADGRALPNALILDEMPRRLGAPMKNGLTENGELSYGRWFASGNGADIRYPGACIVNCNITLYFGGFPKGKARVNPEDLGALWLGWMDDKDLQPSPVKKQQGNT
jgi:hypothetical protein